MGASEDPVKVRRLRVRLSAQNLDQVAGSFKANLSKSGVFLKVPKELKPKDPVAVEILLADRTRFLAGEGRVTWVGEPSAHGLRGISCDVAWDDESQRRVHEILSRTTLPPPPGEAPRAPPEQHVTVDSLPAPAPSPEASMGTEDVTETNGRPSLPVANLSGDLVPPLEQAATLEETAESPLEAGFVSTPEAPSPEEPHQEEELTMESAAPDFNTWADNAALSARETQVLEGEDPTDDGAQKSGMWRWIKKRFGSNA